MGLIAVNGCIQPGIASAGEMAPDIGRVTTREKVGPLEVEYAPGAPYVRYRAIDNLLAPLLIGEDVTIAHQAMLHGCTIGNRVLIGMKAMVMDGAVIGRGSIVASRSPRS